MTMAHETLTCFLLLQLLLFLRVGEVKAKIPAVIVFGDSTVDAGNNNQIITPNKANFKPYGQDFVGGKPTGRFSNGRLVTDFVSEALRIKPSIPAYLDPEFDIEDFATGVTFASASSGYDNLTSKFAFVIPLSKQLEYFKEYKKRLTSFLGENKSTETLREALYILSMGANDFIISYFFTPMRSLQYSTVEYEDFLVGLSENFIKELYMLGARKISIFGIPAIGCLPFSRTSNLIFGGRACREDINKVAREFNGKLQDLVANLGEELEGIKLVYSDLYNNHLQIIQKPNLYGLENVSEGSCGTGWFEMSYLCYIANLFKRTDASKSLYWDAMHPTEKVHKIVADNLMKTSLANFI